MALLDTHAPPGGGDVLAGEPGGEHVDRLHCGPVDGADVAEVGHTGQPGGEDLSDVRVGVGDPGDASAAERGQHTEVQSEIAGTHRPDDRSRARAIYALDWEFAGHSDAAYDAAELIEHPSARAIDDDLWLALLPELGVNDGQARRRFVAARRTAALRWLAVRWKRRDTNASAFEQQLHRTRSLITGDHG